MLSRRTAGQVPLFSGPFARRSSAIGVAVALGVFCAACGSTSASQRAPEPAWAQGLAAQREARIIEGVWRDAGYAERLATLPLLSRFLLRYPDDPRAASMRLRLAWLRLRSRDLDSAEQLLVEVKPRVSGVTADLAEVLSASIAARRGKADEALARLRVMSGRLVDPETRQVWATEALEVAHLARSPDDAVSIMLAWRSFCPDEHIERVEREITERLERLEPTAQLRAFRWLRISSARPVAEESRQRARAWLLQTLRASLSQQAQSTNNGELARLLVEDAPARFLRSSEGERLRRLAQSTGVPEMSMHAAIGYLLELDDDRTKRQSAELLTGAMRALASLGKDEPIRLLTREARSQQTDDVEHALDSLVTDGAALIVGGLSPETSRLAYKLAARHRVTVIALTPTDQQAAPDPFLFSVESPIPEVRRIFQATSDPSKAVELDADHPFCRAEDQLGSSPGSPSASSDVLVTADAGCATRLQEQLEHTERSLRVWLGPDAVRVADEFESATVISSPQLLGQIESSPVSLWRERFQRAPGWYEALGYDVTRLGIEAIRQRGFESLRGDELVRKDRAKLRDALAKAKAELMTTRQRGFSAGLRLIPTLIATRTHSPADAKRER